MDRGLYLAILETHDFSSFPILLEQSFVSCGELLSIKHISPLNRSHISIAIEELTDLELSQWSASSPWLRGTWEVMPDLALKWEAAHWRTIPLGSSLKYACCRAERAEHLESGSHSKQRFINPLVASEYSLNLIFMVILPFSRASEAAGNLYSSLNGMLWNWGQFLSDGGCPNSAIINCTCSLSLSPGRTGAWRSNSPRTRPRDQMSTALPYFRAPNKSSGARYLGLK